MKKIMTAAVLLSTIGSGVALAQGAPPGFGSWQSGWPGTIEAHQAQATSVPRAITTRPHSRTALARNSGSVPVTGNAQGDYRGG